MIAPLDPAHSVMLARISVRGSGQMPPLGSNELDAANIALLTAWINSIGALPPSNAVITITVE